MNISIKLKRLRESRGWTQNQAAEALGIACSTYRLYEKTGGRLPPAEVIAQICRVFSVSSDFLLDLSTEEQAQPLTVSEDLREPAGALMKEAAALCELENSRPYDRPALPARSSSRSRSSSKEQTPGTLSCWRLLLHTRTRRSPANSRRISGICFWRRR